MRAVERSANRLKLRMPEVARELRRPALKCTSTVAASGTICAARGAANIGPAVVIWGKTSPRNAISKSRHRWGTAWEWAGSEASELMFPANSSAKARKDEGLC